MTIYYAIRNKRFPPREVTIQKEDGTIYKKPYAYFLADEIERIEKNVQYMREHPSKYTEEEVERYRGQKYAEVEVLKRKLRNNPDFVVCEIPKK